VGKTGGLVEGVKLTNGTPCDMESSDQRYVPPPPSISPNSPGPAHPVAGVPQKRLLDGSTTGVAATEKHDPSLDPEAGFFEWVLAVLRDAVAYPLRKDGWAILIPGAILSVLLGIGSIAPLFGIFAGLFGVGIFAAYYFEVIETTMSGRESAPDWPSLSNLSDDVWRPAFQIVGVYLISFFPGILFFSMTHEKPSHETGFIAIALDLFGSFYHPMACVALILHGSVFAALPHKVLPAIAHSLPGYLVPVVFLLFVKAGIGFLLQVVTPLPALFEIMSAALIGFFTLIIQARIAGLAGRRFRDKLGWG